MTTEATPGNVRLNDGLGASDGFTKDGGMEFWANLVIANVWIAAETGPLGSWPAVIHLTVCVAMLWRHWWRAWRAGRSA